MWDIFVGRCLEPNMADENPIPYDQFIRRHGLDSPSNAFNLLHSAKRTFLRHLREVVSEYAGTSDEVDEELAYLRRRLAAMSSRPAD
jgi:hypothetical protein